MDKVCQYIDNFNNTPYTITNKIIGEGKSSIVYYGYNKIDLKEVAIKKSSLVNNKGHNIYFEAMLMKKLVHKGIPKIYGFYKDKLHYYIVMEYIKGEDLIDYILNYNKKIELSKIKKFSRQLVEIIKYVHNNNIIHRDIKLENIIIEKGTERLVLIDFGFGDIIQYKNGIETTFDKFCGSPAYVAPEIWDNKVYCGKPVDIWSLGVVIYTITMGKFPYNSDNIDDINENDSNNSNDSNDSNDSNQRIYNNIILKKVAFDGIQTELSNFLKSMLTIDPEERVDINSLSQSPWIKNNYFTL